MIAREDMADAFWGRPEDEVQFAHGHTFAGNPLACAAGMAVIDEIVERKLEERAVRLGDYQTSRLEGLRKYGVVREVRGKGILLGVELTVNVGNALKRTALENGLILRVYPTWFAVAPALTATEEQIDEMCGLIEKSLEAALESYATAPGAAARAALPSTPR